MLFTILALLATVLALVCMGYFMLGSLPAIAAFGAVSYLLARQLVFALGMAVLLGLTLAARRVVLGAMDAVRAGMTTADTAAIARFRRIHVGGMALNAAQLLALGAGLTQLRL